MADETAKKQPQTAAANITVDLEKLMKHVIGMSKELTALKDDNARIKGQMDEINKREEDRRRKKIQQFVEVRGRLKTHKPDLVGVMGVMNLLMVLDISDDSRKKLCDMYMQVQGGMMVLGNVGNFGYETWWRELLDIVETELGEASANENPLLQLESAQRQITSKIAGHSNSLQKS